MKANFFTSIGLTFIICSISAQDLVYTVQGIYKHNPIALDSILIENQSNGDRLLFDSLPEQDNYRINLFTGEVEEPTGVVLNHRNNHFTVVRNLPGNIGISMLSDRPNDVSISIFNIQGQLLWLTQDLKVRSGNLIDVYLPGIGIYIVKISSEMGSNAFQGSGFSDNETFRVFVSGEAVNNDNRKKSALESYTDDFRYKTGQSLLISTYKDGYYSEPKRITIDSSASLRFLLSIAVTDIDGNIYPTVEIGNQTWMAMNLKVTHYPDGSEIPLVEDNSDWDALGNDSKAYCWYRNFTSYRDKYGGLYTWAAAMNGAAGINIPSSGVQGACPDGWHLPRDSEWKTLEMFLGMSKEEADTTGWRGTDEGGKLKDTTDLWSSPNREATNESGFTALPGGYRGSWGGFDYSGRTAYFWTSTEYNESRAHHRELPSFFGGTIREMYFKNSGYSVRCIKGTAIQTLPTIANLSLYSITDNSAILQSEIVSDGGAEVTIRGICWSSSPNPTIENDTTADGKGIGEFTSYMSGLTADNIYYVRAYAINNVGTGYSDPVSFRTEAGLESVTDYEGNVHQTVQIGYRVWMAENLKSTYYSDGTAIPIVEGESEWENLGDDGKAFCWYDNNADTGNIYGALYTWAAAMNGAAETDANPSNIQGVCPSGWHLPSDSEWMELEIYLGMNPSDADEKQHRGTDEGGKLKDTDTTLWANPNVGATNESGFSALPGGHRGPSGVFYQIGDLAGYWTTTEHRSSLYFCRMIFYFRADIFKDDRYNHFGYSVRCIRD